MTRFRPARRRAVRIHGVLTPSGHSVVVVDVERVGTGERTGTSAVVRVAPGPAHAGLSGVTLILDPAADVTRDGRDVAPGDLRPGDRLTLDGPPGEERVRASDPWRGTRRPRRHLVHHLGAALRFALSPEGHA